MQVTRRTEYLLEDDNGRIFHLGQEPVSYIDPVVEDVEDGVLVRYAVHDGDCPEYGHPDTGLRLFRNGTEASEFLRKLNTCSCGSSREDHRKVFVDYSPRLECPDGPGHYFEPEYEWTEDMFWVEKYEHGLVNYALSNESSMFDRAWDVTSYAGVITTPGDLATIEERLAYARAFLAEYSSWCNGESYGVIQELHRLNGDEWELFLTDDCWGFIGTENAEAVVKEGL